MSPFCVHRNSLLMLPGLEQRTLHDLTKPHYRSQTAVYTRFLIYYSLYTILLRNRKFQGSTVLFNAFKNLF